MLHNQGMLDVRRMQVLATVVETGSITAAAAKLGYTVSAISQQVAVLEKETGTPLLERVGRGIRPTPAGVLLAEHARRIDDQMADAERELAALRSGQTGRLSLAAFPTAGSGLVPNAVKTFRERCPGVQLDLNVAEAEDAVGLLRRGAVDLAVVLEDVHNVADLNGLAIRHLFDDPFRIALPKDHRMAKRRSIELSDLADEPFIAATCSRGACERAIMEACQQAGFTPEFAVEADDYPSVQNYVAVGLGVAIIPVLALSAVSDNVSVRTIRGHEPIRHIYAATRGKPTDGPVPVMIEALLAAAGNQRSAA